MVADELLARLNALPGIARAFDTELPDGYTLGASPALILKHISSVPDIPIDGEILGTEERYQVSVVGTNLANVRTVAASVRDGLHGYCSDSIKLVEFESWPGTIAEGSGPTRTYHAPVDFIVQL